MPGEKYERLLDASTDVFMKAGFHAAGVDAIVHATGISKVTLYSYFGSKDGLIAAVLERYSAQWREWFFSEVSERTSDPVKRILTLFDVLGAWFGSDGFRGCLFSTALAEFPAAKHPARRAALAHRRAVHADVRKLARSVRGVKLPTEELTRRIVILMDGAITAAAGGDIKAARDARAMAAGFLPEERTRYK